MHGIEKNLLKSIDKSIIRKRLKDSKIARDVFIERTVNAVVIALGTFLCNTVNRSERRLQNS